MIIVCYYKKLKISASRGMRKNAELSKALSGEEDLDLDEDEEDNEWNDVAKKVIN